MDIYLLAVICGFITWLALSKTNKWYWKTLIFLVIIISGWVLSAVIGFYVDSDDGSLKYLTSSPIWLIIACSIGARKAKRKKIAETSTTPSQNRNSSLKKKIRLDTPFKRIGLVLLSLYALSVIGLAAHWNFTEKHFFYQTNDWRYGAWERIPPKPKAILGQGWMRHEKAWVETSTACDAKEASETFLQYYNRTNQKEKLHYEKIKAKIKFKENLSHEEKQRLEQELILAKKNIKKGHFCPIGKSFLDVNNYRWENSFEDFFEHLFEFWQLTFLFFSGLFFVFGFADLIITGLKKVYIWIKTGH